MTGFSRPPRLMNTRYALSQSSFWMAYCGLVSFAATFLTDKGFAASEIGVVLALASLLSCALQPFVASFADRTRRAPLTVIIAVIAALSCLCVTAVLTVPMPKALFGGVYLTGTLLFDSLIPLLNAMSVYYTDNGAPINYGLGRGVGSAMFGAASIAVGKGMALFGADVMPLFTAVLMAAFILITLSYPLPRRAAPETADRPAEGDECCSLGEFLRRYRWFCLTLLGVLFMASFHSMSENYMINIFRRLGGDSDSVGVALAIATVLEVPVFLWFVKIKDALTIQGVMKVASVAYLVKSVILVFAGSVGVIYLAQVIQIASYGLCSPGQVFFANERIAQADMVKGQAFATASYALGCALGNLLGGQLIQYFGVPTLLWAGVGLAALGVAAVFLTVERKDPASLALAGDKA